MDEDDRQTGRVLSRREVLAMLGATGVAAVSAYSHRQSHAAAPAEGTPPACVVTPQQTEGPYFVDERLNRSDIRSDFNIGVVAATRA